MYCLKCGKQLPDNSKFCLDCGTPMPSNQASPNNSYQNNAYQNTAYNSPSFYGNYQPPTRTHYCVNVLSNKINTNGIIWLVIGILQIILFWYFFEYYDMELYSFALIGLGTFNIISACTDFRYSKSILTSPVDIVSKFEPVGGAVASLIFNILFGGIIGVIGSIYYFTIRSYVLNNKEQFMLIEREYLNTIK